MTTATKSPSRSRSSPRWKTDQPEYRLTKKQHEFCASPSPAILYRGGVASGKTYSGIIRTIARRYEFPGTTQLIAGPSWDQVRDGTQRTLRRLLNPDCIKYENKVDHVMELDNGSELIFRTMADPDVLRALEFHDAYIDEIAMCSEQSLDITLGRLRLPYHDPAFRHSFWGTTTPRGMDWTLDVWGQDGKPGYEVVHSTIYDNKINLPDGYIERLEEKYRDTPFFEQELLGMYTAFEGLVYPMFLRATHVKEPAFACSDARNRAVGLDWGGTAAPTAGVHIGESASRHAHQFAEFYKTGASLNDVVTWLDEQVRAAKITRQALKVFCDTTEQTSINELVRLGFQARGANKDRLAGINHVAGRLRDESLTISPECAYTISEYGQYIWANKKNAETKVVYASNQPIDHHADAMDATRYCLMGMQQVPVSVPGKKFQARLGEVRA